MGETPEEIRRDIEQTRGRMTDTVEAIGYRADVKTRAKEGMVEKKNSLVDKAQSVVSGVTGAMPDVGGMASSIGDAASSAASSVGGATSSAASTVGDTLPDRQQVRQAVSVAQSNPVGLAIGATAVGFLVGMAIPSTRVEDEKFGELGDQVRGQVKEAGQEVLQHGREVAQEAGRAAADTMQQQGQEHGQELASSLQESARDLTSSE